MGKGFGIASLVFAIFSIFVPIVTLYVVWLSLALAAVAGLLGDKTFTLAALVISLINIIFLSPMTWAALAGENMGGGSILMITTAILFLAPVAAMIFGAKRGDKQTANAID